MSGLQISDNTSEKSRFSNNCWNILGQIRIKWWLCMNKIQVPQLLISVLLSKCFIDPYNIEWHSNWKLQDFYFKTQHWIAKYITLVIKPWLLQNIFDLHIVVSVGGRPDKVHNNVVRPLSRILFLTTSHFYNLCHKVYHAEPCHCQPGLLKYSIFEYCKSPRSNLIVFNNKINTHPL